MGKSFLNRAEGFNVNVVRIECIMNSDKISFVNCKRYFRHYFFVHF